MDELEAVGDPELRSALLFARAQARPVTADELAAEQGIHRNVARSRLERLVEAGLLGSGYERRTGRTGPGAGRPAKTYAVQPSLRSIEFPGRRYESLVGVLLDALPVKGRVAKLHAAGVEFGEQLAHEAGVIRATTNAEAFEEMCAAVRRLGFQAAVVEADEEHAVIATPTCPLRPLVQARAEAAELDRGMWAGLASSALPRPRVSRVSCETKNCLEGHESCRVLVTLALDSKTR